jgi:uncharacterized repeat protein (TIGR02543 family)
MVSMLRKRSSVKFVGAVIVLLLLASPLLAVVNVSAAPALSLKWSATRAVTGAATRVGAQVADLRPDIPGLEVVVTGIDGGIESGLTNGYVTCLNGQTGARIWRVTLGSNAIRNHSPFEIADLDKDGTMEIVVAAWTRTIALNGEDGSVYWNAAAPSYDCWPAICDVDGDGYPEVFVSSGFGPDNGFDYLTKLSYNGAILKQTSSWHPCWSGLAIADANSDGRFEIYQGDRSVNFNNAGDPYKNGGKGVRCLDAITLEEIWTSNTLNPEISASSHIPMLADVDKDGVLDVIVGRQSIANGIAVLKASDGSVVTTGGKYRNGGSISQHSQPTICDIDYDGNLEMICGQGTNYVWDLFDWKLDATLPVASGDPPKVGDINGDGRLEIIAFDDYYMRSYQVFANGSVVQVDVVGGLSNPNPFTLLADVDADGLNELVVTSTSGNVYCYNALSAVSSPRQSWETGFYSNYRLGVAEYVAPPTIKYPLTVNVVGSGQVTKDPDQSAYEPGTVVTLTATPQPEATFIGWSGDLSGSTTPTTITMDSGKTVTATFTVVDHDDVVFDSSFDMGNLKNVVYQSGDAGGNRYYTGEQEHTTVSGMADKHWWFYFSMDQVDGKTVTMKLVNNEAADFSGNRWNEIEPVYSFDNTNWLRLPLSNVVVDATARTFQMTVPSSLTTGHSKVWLAPLPPYNIAKRDALFTEFASSPYLTVSSLGTTPGGQQLKEATITDPAYSDAGKFRSYVIAQQHAGEIPGSWNAEGLIRFLLSSDPTAVAIRRSYIFKIVPIVNVDGVYQGISRYTGLRSGAQYDLNRDWTSRTQPEIQWIWADMVAFQPDSFNDMHSTINTEVSSPKALLTYSWSTSDPELLAFRADVRDGGFPETVTGVSGYACSIVHTSFGIDPSVSWENPHDEHSAYPGVKLTVNDWMSWGAAWAKGNYLYFGAVQGTVTITIDGGGSVVKSPDQATYDWGTDVQLTANPSTGWTFSGWTGDVSGTANPATLTISGDHSVTAHFIPVGGNAPPIISLPQPADGALDVPISTSTLSFTITDFDGDPMDYSVTTLPNVGTGSETGKADGTYSIPVSGLAYSTTYSWTVSVYDGTDTTIATYTFTTEALSYDDVIFDSSFDMGNLNNVIFQSGDASGNRYYTGEQEHTTVSFADKHWWFYFSMDNVAGKTVTIKFVNNEAVDFSTNPTTGNRWPEIEPVFSYDNINWQRVPLTGISFDRTLATYTITITLPVSESKVWLAPVPPYNIAKRDALIAEFTSSPYLTVSSLGTTPGGQQLKVLTITDPAYPDAGKFKSYVIAQQHVGEVGSWNAEGLVRFLLSDDPQAAAVRRSFIFRIVPIVNVDGVYEGVSRYTPLRSGVQYDLNRWWDATSQANPNCPVETKWIFADMQTFQPDSFNDFHSTINTEVTSPKEALTYSWSTSDPALIAFRAKIKLGGYPETVAGVTGSSYCAPQIHTRLGVVLSVSWENPHDELSTYPGVKLTVNDWMAWGAGWAKGNYLYFVGPFNSVPVVSLPNPADGAVGVPTSTSTLSFTISDADGELMDYSVATSPNIGSGSGTGVSDGTYSIPILGLASATTYSWTVEVNDGTDLTSVTYTFTTEGAIMHTLSITVVGQGQVDLDKVGPYPEGTVVELTAVADAGWTFSGWSVDLSGSNNPESITMDGDKSVTATFTQEHYTLDITVVGNGVVTKLPDQAFYVYGDVVELTADPDDDWSFSGWSGDASGTELTTSVTMTSSKSVTATFTSTLQLYLPFTTDASDFSSYNNDGVTGGGVVHTTTYGGAYIFDGSTGYINVADNPDGSLDGNGAWDKLTIELWVKPDLASSAGQRILRKGGSSAPYSYQIGFQTTGGRLYFDVWNPTVMYEVESPTLLSANTWYHIVCVYQSGVGSKIYVNGVDVGAVKVSGSETGNIGASRERNLYIGCRYGTQNFFDGYIDEVQIYSEALSGAVAFEHYDAAKAEHADYALTVTPIGSGTVAKNPSQATYAYGTSVELTATAADGWSFSAWSGGLISTTNPDYITIDGDKSVTATFLQNEYTLDITVVGSGSVTKTPNQATYHYGDVVQLEATPADGWSFSAWSGDASGSANPTTVTIDGNKAVVASFTSNPTNTNPVINYVHVWGYPGGLLDPAGSIRTGESIRIFSGVLDAETVSSGLTVHISYKAQSDSSWTGPILASWEPLYGGYWYYDWSIPSGASVGLYDVKVEASDPDGGSASLTGTNMFTVVKVNTNPVVNYVHVWGYPGGLLDPAGTIRPGEAVRIFTSITDAETPSNQLTVTISYKAQSDSVWTSTSALWEPLYGGYWYYDWVIPQGVSSGLYDVMVEASDQNGGFILVTEYGEFNVVAESYTLTVTVAPSSAAGTVSADISEPYHLNDVVTLTATADAGWSFDSATGWSGAGSTDGSGNRVVSITGNMAVTATFTQDLKMHLPFSDSTVPIPDASGNDNVGTPYNGVAWQSTYGGVYSFDQTNDYITVADSASLDGRGSWSQLTVEFWVKTDDAAPSAQRILRKGPSTGTGVNSYQVGFQTTGSFLYFDVWAPGSAAGAYYEVQYNTVLTAGTWYHVVCVYVAGQGSKIYVNGVDVGATRVGTTGDPTKNVGGSVDQPLYIGCRYNNATPGPNQFFDGLIDEVQIYSVALSSGVVQQHYDDTKAVHADYTLTVTATGSGTVAKVPDQALYAYGSVVELTAVADAGWSFSAWSGDVVGSGNPVQVTMDGAKSATATFTENPVTTYTLTVNVAGQGHVDLDPVGGVYDPDTMVELTAVPDAGWGFVEWSGALTGSTNPITITMDASKAVTATFADLTPLMIDDNFDSGSIGTYSVLGNEISFNMVLETLTPTGEQYAYWTYFKVTNTMDEEVTFRVTNAADVPFLASTIREAQMVYSYDGDTWSRITAHSYSSGVYTFTQSFTSNEVYIATFFPFPYAEMQSFVSTVDASEWVEKTVLGSSEQGRDINLLTITNPSIPLADKTVIYIVGRQHSAETASSYMLRGLINFLISGDAVAQRLRDDFVWYIVPMVNPDGVYLGASRATADLRNANRDWKNTETAEINLVKAHVTSIDTAYSVDFFIDWHSQMDDTTWANFVYSPSGNTFDSILEAYTDFDIQYPSTAAQGSETDCTAREWISWNIILNPMYVLEPSPHLYTWTEASLEQQGVNVALAINEYFPIIYTITATAGVGGTISPSGDVEVSEGTDQSFTITADGGYEIADVVVDSISVGPVSTYPFTNVVANHNISASFSPVAVTYTIGASAGAGGSISPSGSVIVSQGADQTFTVTPDAGYHISDVVVDSVSVGAVGSYPFTNVQDDHTIAAIFEADVLVGLLVDGEFDYSHSSQYLRDDGVGQDWYESRNQAETLLTLDTESVGGNDGRKASLKNYGTTSSNVYLTQNFAAQRGTFSVQFDIYIDQIQDNANYDRTGHIYIGNDWNVNGIPLDTARERFVLLAFYDSSPSTDGDLQLRARTLSTTAQSWSNTSLWPTVASGLSYDTWYTVKVSVNYVAGTYDVTFNGVTTTFSKMDIYNTATDPAISLISFAADSDGRGDFYVDNVFAYVTHTITASASTGGSIEPVGAVVVADGTDQTFIIATDTGYEITEVLVDGIPQVVASTYTFYDVTGDHSISVSFSLIP